MSYEYSRDLCGDELTHLKNTEDLESYNFAQSIKIFAMVL